MSCVPAIFQALECSVEILSFASSLVYVFGGMYLFGLFFMAVCTVVFVLWKLNDAAWRLMLAIPRFVMRFIFWPLALICLLAWDLIRHPPDIYPFFRGIAIYNMAPFLFVYYFLKAIFRDPFVKVWVFFKNRSAGQCLSQFPKRP